MYTLNFRNGKIYLGESSGNMLLFFKSFINTITALSWVDIVFLFAVIFLIILVVTLVYFVLINKDEEVQRDDKMIEGYKKSDVTIFEDPNEKDELLDLKSLTKKLEEEKDKPIIMNDYEEEQEQKAIISYDELLASQKDNKINYEEEQQLGDLTVKKVNIDNISIPKEEKVTVISYEKEEAFLEALKKLQEQIN